MTKKKDTQSVTQEKKAAEIKTIMENLRPNTYTKKSTVWKRAMESLFYIPLQDLQKLTTVIMCVDHAAKAANEGDFTIDITTEEHESLQKFSPRFPAESRDEVTTGVKYLNFILGPELQAAWMEGDLSKVKKIMKEMDVVLRNTRRMVKKQLWDSLR